MQIDQQPLWAVICNQKGEFLLKPTAKEHTQKRRNTTSAVHAKRVTVMPHDIRLTLRIRGDHFQWRITPKDAARYERHQKRMEGGATYNFLS